MNKLKFKKKIRIIEQGKLQTTKFNNKSINLINVDCDINKKSLESNKYIKTCFELAFKILKNGFTHKFINGPVDKSKYLEKNI